MKPLQDCIFNGGRIWRLCSTCSNTKASFISCTLFCSLASVILHAVACWDSRLSVAGGNKLNKLICTARNAEVVSERRMLSRIRTMLDNTSNPLHDMLANHRSTLSERLRLPKCTTERHRK